MIKWAIQKWIIGQMNSLLTKYRNDIDKVKDILQKWISRLEKILSCFKSMLSKLDDGKIDEEEIDMTIEEVSEVVKQW